MKIVFFGTPEFAVPVLKKLIESSYDVIGVFAGNGPVVTEANKYNISVFKPASLKKDEAMFEQFKSLKPDICVIAAYGKIIPSRYFEIPKYGFLNVHPSILPTYRGPSPVQTAILNGDIETGASIMIVDKEVDHGPILESRKWKIESREYHYELAKELFTIGAGLLVEILPRYISGELKPQEQDHSKATFTKMFSREDGKINWQEPAEKIYNRIRALNPEPGTWTMWKGKVVNIKKAKLADGKLAIEILQLEGKRETPFREFLNGHPDFDISQLD